MFENAQILLPSHRKQSVFHYQQDQSPPDQNQVHRQTYYCHNVHLYRIAITQNTNTAHLLGLWGLCTSRAQRLGNFAAQNVVVTRMLPRTRVCMLKSQESGLMPAFAKISSAYLPLRNIALKTSASWFLGMLPKPYSIPRLIPTCVNAKSWTEAPRLFPVCNG